MFFRRFLYFCLFTIPFLPQGVGFYLGFGIPMIDLPRILMAILIIVWLLRKFIRGEPFRFFRDKINAFLFAVIVVQFLSSFISGNILLSFSQWFGYVFYYYLIFFILADQISGDAEAYKILKIVFGLTIAMSIVSITEFILQKGLYDNLRTAWVANPDTGFQADVWRREGLLASKGPFGTTQPFGSFFALTLFIAIYFFYVSRGWRNKLGKFLVAFGSFVALLATQVRSAIIAAIFVFVISLARKKAFLNYLRNAFAVVMAAIIILILAFKYLPPDTLRYTFYDSLFIVSREESSYFKRLDGLKYTLDQLWSRPLLGYGTGAVYKHLNLNTGFNLGTDLPIELVYFVESGFFAFMFFSLLQFYSLYLIYRKYKEETDQQKKNLLFYLLLGFLAFYISLLGSPHMEGFFTFFVLLAVGSQLIGSKKQTVFIA